MAKNIVMPLNSNGFLGLLVMFTLPTRLIFAESTVIAKDPTSVFLIPFSLHLEALYYMNQL